MAQTVTVTGVNDDLDDGDIAYSIVTAAATSSDTNYDGDRRGRRRVTNTDNDASGITVTHDLGPPRPRPAAPRRSRSCSTAQPTADVTIALTSSDTTKARSRRPA